MKRYIAIVVAMLAVACVSAPNDGTPTELKIKRFMTQTKLGIYNQGLESFVFNDSTQDISQVQSATSMTFRTVGADFKPLYSCSMPIYTSIPLQTTINFTGSSTVGSPANGSYKVELVKSDVNNNKYWYLAENGYGFIIHLERL